MRLTPGTVVGGKVVVDGAPLDEGACVVVLSRDSEGLFSLTAEDEEELFAAIAEIERGESVHGASLLEELRKYEQR